jgi:hypothetical protein
MASNCAKRPALFPSKHELPAMVALSHPWSRLPMEAAMATSTAPDMAGESYYRCKNTINTNNSTRQHAKSRKHSKTHQKTKSDSREEPGSPRLYTEQRGRASLAYPRLDLRSGTGTSRGIWRAGETGGVYKRRKSLPISEALPPTARALGCRFRPGGRAEGGR